MTWLQAVLLGLLQGLTEFLPVSSTAHMDVIPQLFGMRDPGAAFSAICQLGPIAAIILYFRSDLMRYVKGILRTGTPANLKRDDVDARLGWFTLIGSVPIAIAGVLLEKYIDHHFRRLDVVAAALIVLAFVLAYAERVGRRNVSLEQMTFKQAMVVGLAQMLGLVPGASRSGSTITAGLLQGLDRESAARFSFLLSIPAITGAGVYKLFKVLKAHQLHGEAGMYVFAAIVAGAFAYVVVRWFMGYMKEHNTGIFIVYRIVFGIAILVLFHTGILKEHQAEDIPAPHVAPVSLAPRPASQRVSSSLSNPLNKTAQLATNAALRTRP